jgi:hypothetical protein
VGAVVLCAVSYVAMKLAGDVGGVPYISVARLQLLFRLQTQDLPIRKGDHVFRQPLAALQEWILSPIYNRNASVHFFLEVP